MSNTIWPIARHMAANTGHNWGVQNVNVCLVDDTYSFQESHYRFLHLGGSTGHGDAGAAGVPLTYPTPAITDDGACTADDARWTNVQDVGGNTNIIAVAAYFQGKTYNDFTPAGGQVADPLLFFIDTATGLSLKPNGGDVIAVWDTGINKIYRL